MKTLILSPLFPPDTGAPATYVKELATRLQTGHQPTLLIYGYLPETVPGVPCVAIDKRAPVLLRLFSFTKSLLSQSKKADLILVNNAPSTELPLFLVSLFARIPFILIISDPVAEQSSSHGIYRLLHRAVKKRAKKIITLESETLYTKAEILPFVEFDAAREARRQDWWKNHLLILTS